MMVKEMTYYCNFYIKTNNSSPHPSINKEKRKIFNIRDKESSSEKASVARLSKRGINSELPFRYYFLISTKGRVISSDPLDHVKWILEELRPISNLSELASCEAEYGFSFYWEGLGTGGGPLITPELSKLLYIHNANMAFGFYYDNAE